MKHSIGLIRCVNLSWLAADQTDTLPHWNPIRTVKASEMTRQFLPSLTLALAIGVCLTGCRGHQFFGPPGPLQQQQAAAVIHDPYPQNDIGPYEAGARPPGYQNPLPEPVRNRIVPDSMPWLGR